MGKHSAGIVLHRCSQRGLELLLVHPGGPYWARRDEGAWSIPKGEVHEDEAPVEAARRELEEETGVSIDGELLALGSIHQRGGKRVEAWACARDCDAGAITSNTFELEWPPRSGRMRTYPEVDRAEWFDVETARSKLNPAQVELVERLVLALEHADGSDG